MIISCDVRLKMDGLYRSLYSVMPFTPDWCQDAQASWRSPYDALQYMRRLDRVRRAARTPTGTVRATIMAPKPTILVVDDDPAIRTMVRLMLARLACTVVEANDGE